MPTIAQIEDHHGATRNRELRYQFTPKHHGCGGDAACWHPELTRDQEFSVFDTADFHLIEDQDGNLYGVGRIDEGDSLWVLGTWNQQVAKFPAATPGSPWHGYPLYPLQSDAAPDNRKGQRLRPDKAVLIKMNDAGVITGQQRKRLMRGDEA